MNTTVRYRLDPSVRLRLLPQAEFELQVLSYFRQQAVRTRAELGAMQLLARFIDPCTIAEVRQYFVDQGQISEAELDEALSELQHSGLLVPLDDEPKGTGLSKSVRTILSEGASKGVLPANVPCRIGCKFCYERHYPELFPTLTIDRLPVYTEAMLDYFFYELNKHPQPIRTCALLRSFDGVPHYGSHCDFFSLGLQNDQVERILQHNESFLSQPPYAGLSNHCRLYTTGYGLAPETARYLAAKYPHSFLLWISIITFNERRKAELVRNFTPTDRLIEIIKTVAYPSLWLAHLTPQQTLADLELLNSLQLTDFGVSIHELHYNRCHGPRLRSLAEQSNDGSLAQIAKQISQTPERFTTLTDRIHFLGPPTALARANIPLLRQLFAPFVLAQEDVVLCSVAAETAMQRALDGRATVRSVADSLGGSTSFTATLSCRDLAERLNQLQQQGVAMRRVFIPSAIFTEGRDVEGHTAEWLARQFPELKFVMPQIPPEALTGSLTARQCAAALLDQDLETTSEDRLEPCSESLLDPTWAGKAVLKALFESFILQDSDLVLCGPTAYQLLYDLLSPARLQTLPGGRGEAEHAGTLSAEIIIQSVCEASRAGPTVRRVFIPSSRWAIPEQATVLTQLRSDSPEVKWVALAIPEALPTL